MSKNNTPDAGHEESDAAARRRRLIENDMSQLGSEEAAALSSRRQFFGRAALGAAAAGYVMAGGPTEAKAEGDAVKRAMDKKENDNEGNNMTRKEMQEKAEEINKQAEEQYGEDNPGLIGNAKDNLFWDVVFSHDVYRDSAPFASGLIRDLTWLKRVSGTKTTDIMSQAMEMADDSAVPEHTTEEVKAWQDEMNDEIDDLLIAHSKRSGGITDLLAGLNAIEGLLHRAPKNLFSGRIGLAVANIGLNATMLTKIIKGQIADFSGDDSRHEKMTTKRRREVKNVVRRAGNEVVRAEKHDAGSADMFNTRKDRRYRPAAPVVPDAAPVVPDAAPVDDDSFVADASGVLEPPATQKPGVFGISWLGGERGWFGMGGNRAASEAALDDDEEDFFDLVDVDANQDAEGESAQDDSRDDESAEGFSDDDTFA